MNDDDYDAKEEYGDSSYDKDDAITMMIVMVLTFTMMLITLIMMMITTMITSKPFHL